MTAATRRDSKTWRDLKRATLKAAAQRNEPCALCGLPVNHQPRDPNADDAPSVDHIKPWKTHANLRLDPANLRVVHQACNRAKGATATVTTPTNTSRQWGRPQH